MIQVGDIVYVTLGNGLLLKDYEVIDIPSNNQMYWTFQEQATGEFVVIGPSLLSIRKII